MSRTVEITITGVVQGVNFRRTAKVEAEKNQITGTVKNVDKNAVYIEASGDEDAINRFIDWCKKGPANAKVSDVVVKDSAQKRFGSFEVIRNRRD